MEKLTIKDVIIKFIDRVLNPKFENNFIFWLFVLWSVLLWYQKIFDLINSFKIKIWDTIIEYNSWWFSYINFFWIILILLSCYFFYKIKIQSDKKITYKTLKKASKTIKKLLDENERIFKNHWPNSSVTNIDKLRNENELQNWYKLRAEKILPNNEKIYNILQNIEKIDDNEKDVVNKMKNHIEAFKKHLEDSTYDYTEHQFPIAFWYLINKYCEWWLLKDRYLNKYVIYINENIKIYNIILSEKYLFWSVLIDKNPFDIDLLIYSNINLEAVDYQKLNLLKKKFYEAFWKKLDITVFSKREEKDFIKFRNKILDLKKI